MEFLIVGLGSMGKRRARLLRGLLPDARVCGVDLSPERQAQAKELGITPYASVAEAAKAEKFDAAFVCTAPLTHAAIIRELLDIPVPVFTELNLVPDGYDELTAKAKETGTYPSKIGSP